MFERAILQGQPLEIKISNEKDRDRMRIGYGGVVYVMSIKNATLITII